MKKIYFTIGFLISILFFSIVNNAFANVLYSQNDLSDELSRGEEMLYQTLGNGMTGTVEYIKLYAKGDGNHHFWLRLFRCNTAVYNYTCDLIKEYETSENMSTSLTYYYANMYSLVLDPTKYYFFETFSDNSQNQTGTGVITMAGRADDNVYEEGECRGGVVVCGEGTGDDMYFKLLDSEGDNETGETRIVSHTPADLVSTSSPTYIEVKFYVSSDDLEKNGAVNWHTWVNTDEGIFSTSIFDESGQITETDGAGYYTYSTTTTLSNGQYEFYSNLQDSCWWIYCHIYDQLKTNFAVSETVEPFESLYEQFQERYKNASSTLQLWDWKECSTDIPACLGHLIVPTKAQLYDDEDSLWNQLQEGVLAKPPFGYLNILIDAILATSTESQLSDLSFTIPSGLPQAGSTITIIDWDTFLGTTSILQTTGATTTGDSFTDITSPYINTLLYILTSITIMFMLIRFNP